MPGLFRSGNWNENEVNILSRINWRASLVPAAAVIPAPIAYIKVVAVKKLVVEFLVKVADLPLGGLWAASAFFESSWGGINLLLLQFSSFTVKKLECSKQA